MFDGLRKFFSKRKQRRSPKEKIVLLTYTREKEGRRFCFLSEFEIDEAQLTAAMDIIHDNVLKGTDGNIISREVWEKCFPTLGSGAIHIKSHDEGKNWEIKLSKNSLAFQ